MWWTSKEAAKLQGCSTRTIRRAIKAGTLRARRTLTFRQYPGIPFAYKRDRYLISNKALMDYMQALEEGSDRERVAKLRAKGGVCPTCRRGWERPVEGSDETPDPPASGGWRP